MPIGAVSFDFGQTLAELDTTYLSARLAERGVRVSAGALAEAVPDAWDVYDAAIRAGFGGHPWRHLMAALLDGAGAAGDRAAAVDWLWRQQPTHNLWRRPIPGVISATWSSL